MWPRHGTVWRAVPPRLLAAVIGAAGALKVAGVASMADRFAAWGWPGWFMQGIGSIELIASALLLAPATARIGGIAVVALQTGALFTRCVHGDSQGALLSSVGLAAALLVTWGAAPEEVCGS